MGIWGRRCQSRSSKPTSLEGLGVSRDIPVHAGTCSNKINLACVFCSWYRHPRPPGGVSNLAFSCRDSESSTTDEYFQRASTLPEPDAGISYSFDAPRGPQQGSQILKAALAKAVEKFEIKATEKLVKEEYEVIGKEKEESDASLDLEDDDYELV